MSDEVTPAPEILVSHSDAADAAARSSPPRNLLGWEVAAVVCLAVLPDALASVARFTGTQPEESMSFAYLAVSLIARSLQVSLPVLVIVQYRAGSLRELGLADRPNQRDAWIAGALFVVGTMAMYAAIYPLYYASWFLFGPDVQSWWASPAGDQFPTLESNADFFLLLPLLSAANGFAEELVMRGYLIPRIEALTRSSAAAVLITALAFATYHLYQGLSGFIGTAMFGIIYGVAFCRMRRLWPLALAHSLADYFMYLWASLG